MRKNTRRILIVVAVLVVGQVLNYVLFQMPVGQYHQTGLISTWKSDRGTTYVVTWGELPHQTLYITPAENRLDYANPVVISTRYPGYQLDGYLHYFKTPEYRHIKIEGVGRSNVENRNMHQIRGVAAQVPDGCDAKGTQVEVTMVLYNPYSVMLEISGDYRMDIWDLTYHCPNGQIQVIP